MALLRRLSLSVLACALLAPPAAPAHARVGPCPGGDPGTSCHIWTGKVTFLDDGDTVDVNIRGDGTSTPRRIRVTGVQAMELSRYSRRASKRRGDCHGVQAADYLERMLRAGHWRVRLAAQDPRSHSRSRLRRHLDVRTHGHWVDAGARLLKKGHALWLPNHEEYAWNAGYRALADAAAARGRHLWNTDSCGGHEAARGVPIGFRLNWDAPHNDFENVNGEWVKITNLSANSILPLGGWWFRDSALRRYTFPPGADVAPGQTVTLYMGHGRSGGDAFYWNQDRPVFENAGGPPKNMGDGGYLFDSRGNLRAWSIY